MTTAPMTPATGPADQARVAWDRLAVGFDQHVTPPNLDLGHAVVRRFPVGPGKLVLDVAAGTGALAIPAARGGGRVVATDVSPVMLGLLDERAEDQGLANLDTRAMDGRALDLDDDVFDLAASQHGVSLLDDVDCGLRELVRVTKPGGRVVVVAFGHRAEPWTFFHAALQATVPDLALPTTQAPTPAGHVAGRDLLANRLVRAGLIEVAVDTMARGLPVASASHLWDAEANADPVAAALVADLTAQQTADAQWVLDGMLRERSGGRPGAVLHSESIVGSGTVC